MDIQKLSYRISSWRQLPKCKSNLSSDYYFEISDLIDDRLSGLRIVLRHRMFGVVFACVTNLSGQLVEVAPDEQIGPAEILAEAHKYGFDITYVDPLSLSGDQIQYLMTLQNLHYDKIRFMSVWHMENTTKYSQVHIIAFKSTYSPDWLNNGYSASRSEYLQALESGNAINIGAISEDRKYDWSWLYSKVLNISDVLSEISEADYVDKFNSVGH